MCIPSTLSGEYQLHTSLKDNLIQLMFIMLAQAHDENHFHHLFPS